jgi:hypothetical protein
MADAGAALAWVSHVWLFIPGLAYLTAMPLMLDAGWILSQLHAQDPILKEKEITTKQAVYDAVRECRDPVAKTMIFYSMLLLRNWGCFQVALGAAIWCVILMVPVHSRAPAHIILGFLQTTVGMNDTSVTWSVGWGADTAALIGGSAPGAGQKVTPSVTPEEQGADAAMESGLASGPGAVIRPNAAGSFYAHVFLGLVNIVIGIFCALQMGPTDFSPPL